MSSVLAPSADASDTSAEQDWQTLCDVVDPHQVTLFLTYPRNSLNRILAEAAQSKEAFEQLFPTPEARQAVIDEQRKLRRRLQDSMGE
jgi:glutamine synthetase